MIFLLVLLLISHQTFSYPTKSEVGSKSIQALQGAGLGWDYLSEDVKYPAQVISYNDNKKTTDGKYLIPDCMAVENVKQTKYTDLADVMTSSSTYISKTSKSMKVSASISFLGVGIGGSYSQDFNEVIQEQRNLSTVTTRTKYYDHRYTLLTNSRCPIDKKFKDAVGDLMFAIEIEDDDLSKYVSQTIIDDYGTHFVSKIKIGGVIYSDDYISDYYWNKMKSSNKTVQISASLMFADEKIKASASFGSSNTVSKYEYDDYKNNIKKTKTEAIGGRYSIGMSASDWASTLEDNYVAIDREGSLISNLLLPSNFPSFQQAAIFKANKYVQEALSEYLTINSIDGCLDKNNINFNPQAHYDSGKSCEDKLKFGGFFSTSKKCSQLNNEGECLNFISSTNEYNLLTKTSSCASGYVAQTGVSKNPWISLTLCAGDGSIQNGGVLFGGIYSTAVDNPVTKSKSCPTGFVPQSIFDSGDNFICQSTDFSITNIRNAVPFGGFIADCFTGLPNECPKGLEIKQINTVNGCQINYCTRIKNYAFATLRRPPFIPKPPSHRYLKFNPYNNN